MSSSASTSTATPGPADNSTWTWTQVRPAKRKLDPDSDTDTNSPVTASGCHEKPARPTKRINWAKADADPVRTDGEQPPKAIDDVEKVDSDLEPMKEYGKISQEDLNYHAERAKVSGKRFQLVCRLTPTCCQLGPFASMSEYDFHHDIAHNHRCSICRRYLHTEQLLHLHLLEVHDSFFAVLADRAPSYECYVEGCPVKSLSPQSRQHHLIEQHRFPADFHFDVVLGSAKALSEKPRGPGRRASGHHSKHGHSDVIFHPGTKRREKGKSEPNVSMECNNDREPKPDGDVLMGTETEAAVVIADLQTKMLAAMDQAVKVDMAAGDRKPTVSKNRRNRRKAAASLSGAPSTSSMDGQSTLITEPQPSVESMEERISPHSPAPVEIDDPMDVLVDNMAKLRVLGGGEHTSMWSYAKTKKAHSRNAK
ncbi:uncharacterized protein BJ171DRAFT_211214 [Polychytrium aggregatum]|uniref:uncharacterized protein n=1 Tax=Polychytrium aggregatum TaxID=110093 RepID=UPI0022FDBEBC|nr:uncharacterized protein BJ171DRAFT_211214 [Polychytrium aggregatum]KAI9208627.1 hypothetical protein BJ171DRAFT_211214 [Polychytrium aggregatum]